MTRIVLLGTSHVAALWQGWGRIAADWPDVEVRAFAAHGQHGAAARLRGRTWGFFGKGAGTVPVFGHDAPTIDLQDFDHVVRVGRGFAEAQAVPLLQSFAVDGITPAGDDRPALMSATAGAAMLEALVAAALPPAEWHGWTAPTLTILQTPYPDSRYAGAALGARHADRQWLARRPDEMLALRRLYLDRFAAALAGIGIGFVPQPAETLGEDGLSLMRYSTGSTRMADGDRHQTGDLLHMNADYGALAMTRLLETLTGQTARAPAAAATA